VERAELVDDLGEQHLDVEEPLLDVADAAVCCLEPAAMDLVDVLNAVLEQRLNLGGLHLGPVRIILLLGLQDRLDRRILRPKRAVNHGKTSAHALFEDCERPKQQIPNQNTDKLQ
jgi:hypothetical protein